MTRYPKCKLPLILFTSWAFCLVGLSGCAVRASLQETQPVLVEVPVAVPVVLDINAIAEQYAWVEASEDVRLAWIIALAQNGNWQEANRLVEQSISFDRLKIKYVQALAEAAPWIAEPQEAAEILVGAEQLAESVGSRPPLAGLAEARRLIRSARITIGDSKASYGNGPNVSGRTTADETKRIQQSIEKLTKSIAGSSQGGDLESELSYSGQAIEKIAANLAKLPESHYSAAQKMNQQLIPLTEKLTFPEGKARAFQAIARTYLTLKAPSQARPILVKVTPSIQATPEPTRKAGLLQTSALLYAELGDTTEANNLMEQVLVIQNLEKFPRGRALLQAIQTYSQIPDLARAQQLVDQGDKWLKTEKDLELRSIELQALAAAAYYYLSDLAQAKKILQQALVAARKDTDPYARARLLKRIARSFSVMNEDALAQDLLEQAWSEIESPSIEPEQRSSFAVEIAEAYNDLSDSKAAIAGLKTAAQAAPEYSAGFRRLIAFKEAEQGNWDQALQTLSQISVEESKLESIAELLILYAEYQHPALIDGAVVLSAQAKERGDSHELIVRLDSPDQSCTQYANWWEVLDRYGNLIQRQLLNGPSFEQPRTSILRQLNIPADQPIFIRAHLHQSKDPKFERGVDAFEIAEYGAQQVLSGTLETGFTSIRVSRNFAAHLRQIGPKPDSCAE